MKNIKSLSKEINVLLIIFSIFVISVIGIFSIANEYNSKIHIIKHNQNQVLSQVSTEIENLISQIDDISFYIGINYTKFDNLLINIVETNKNISSILILDKNGIIEDFYAISNLNLHKGFDYSNKNYYKNLVEKKQNDYWSDVFLSSVDEEPTLAYSFTMSDKIGVIMIKLSEISDFIGRFKNPDSSHSVRLFDKNGIVILNPDYPELVLQRLNASSSEVFEKLINKQKVFTQVIFNSSELNSQQYGAYNNIDKTNWKVVVRQNHDNILNSLYITILTSLIVIALFIFLSIFISHKISTRISNAFIKLQNSINSVLRAEHNIVEEKTYYDEFNTLLNSFYKMHKEIEKREDSLEGSLNNFKVLFNSTMETIIIHDEGICIDANDIAVKFLGFKDKKEIIGLKLINFIAPEYKRLLIKNYNKDTLPYEFEVITNDERRVSCLGRGQFINLNGKRVKLSTIMDITELKYKDKLLFQQTKMASMGEMIGNIAHQWRQPLSLISTSASGIKFKKEFDTIDDIELFESLDHIVNNTKYLSKTIDDFRNFFKPDKSSIDFNISHSIKGAVELLKSSIQNNEIEIIYNLDDEIVVNGYANEFLQVIINIINNSKDAFVINKKNNRIIKIDSYEKNKVVNIKISDNAGGIEASILDKIFDPYFTTKHKSKGTGIGLYMVHQIVVDHMRGNLAVQNSEMIVKNKNMKGCTFIVKIPKNSKQIKN